MKSVIRNIFPGGNTPFGFHSYYNHILPQRKAKKIFCLKGGPGVGKSTLMKNIGAYFEANADDIDYFWCSADPLSLDGILLRDHNISIVDGTAPHIIDPCNPGAVDRIVDLGIHLDTETLVAEKKNIITHNENISELYQIAYAYLKGAYYLRKKMSDSIVSQIPDCDNDIWNKVFSYLDYLRPSEGDHQVSSFFSSAITSSGIIDHTTSLLNDIGNIFIINAPISFNDNIRFERVAQLLEYKGCDVEKYYCPMDPISKIEHIISHKADLAVITDNEYHNINLSLLCDCDVHTGYSDVRYKGKKNLYDELFAESDELINKAISKLDAAKCTHDELEKIYVRHIDFSKVDKEYEMLLKNIVDII